MSDEKKESGLQGTQTVTEPNWAAIADRLTHDWQNSDESTIPDLDAAITGALEHAYTKGREHAATGTYLFGAPAVVDPNVSGDNLAWRVQQAPTACHKTEDVTQAPNTTAVSLAPAVTSPGLIQILKQAYNNGNDCGCASREEVEQAIEEQGNADNLWVRCAHCLAGDALALLSRPGGNKDG